jgi:acetyltransferase-like isoleucine patch superfamily enzyme
MAQVEIRLGNEHLRALSAKGIRLPGLMQTGRLAASSRVEGPTSILASVTTGAHLKVGAFCNLSGGTLNNVEFGRYCSIANGVVIGSHEHPTDWLTTSRTAYYPEVNGWDQLMAGRAAPGIHARKSRFTASCPVTTLGHDVWIGQGAFIKSGVTIGTGAIIGARATVVKDVPPYAIVVGSPGRVLRLRFADHIVERLLAVQWWRYSIYDLFDAPMDNIERALDVIEALIDSDAIQPFEGPMLTAETLAEPASLIASLDARPFALAG